MVQKAQTRMCILSSLLEGVVITTHHTNEKRLGRIISEAQLSCAWYRVLGKKNGEPVKPDHLLFEMEKRWCIKCNTIHWVFGERLDFAENSTNSQPGTIGIDRRMENWTFSSRW